MDCAIFVAKTKALFCRKIGAEGSVLQELYHFVILAVRCLPKC